MGNGCFSYVLFANSNGSRGVGYGTVKHLARLGAKVYLAARDESRAKAAIARLELEGFGPGNGHVLWHELDLSDPRKAKKSAEEFLKKETRLDVLGTCIHLMSKTLYRSFTFLSQ